MSSNSRPSRPGGDGGTDRPPRGAAPGPGGASAGSAPLPPAVREAAAAWCAEALQQVVGTVRRLAPAYRRHLGRDARLRDAVGDLLTLASRRQAPLQVDLQRLWPPGDLPLEVRALASLAEADRRALLEWAAGGALPSRGGAEHRAAALFRLTRALQGCEGLTEASPPAGTTVP